MTSISAQAEVAAARWWTVRQAVAWIVTGDETLVAVAPPLNSSIVLSPNQHTDRPPLSKAQALTVLLEAWRAGQIELYGAKERGQQPQKISPPLAGWVANFVISDSEAQLHLKGDPSVQPLPAGSGASGRFVYERATWSDIWTRSVDCKRVWPVRDQDGAFQAGAANKPDANASQSVVRVSASLSDPTTVSDLPQRRAGESLAVGEAEDVVSEDAGTLPGDREVTAWLVLEQARRIDAKEKHGLGEVRIYLRRKFTHLKRDDADRLYRKLDQHLRPTMGPQKNRRARR